VITAWQLIALGASLIQAQPVDCTDARNIFECPEMYVNTFAPKPSRVDQGEYRSLKERQEAENKFNAGEAQILETIVRAEATWKELDEISPFVVRSQRFLEREGLSDVEKMRGQADLLSLRRRYEEIKTRQISLYNEAITRAIELYHLEPGGVQAPHAYKGQDAVRMLNWAPKYSEKEIFDRQSNGFRLESDEERKNRGLRLFGKPLPTPLGGHTMENAEIRLFRGAFQPAIGQNNTGEFAVSILHETIHWLDWTARGRKLKPEEYFASEDRAYSLAVANANVFKLADDSVAYYRGRAKEARDDVKAVQGLTWTQVEKLHPNIYSRAGRMIGMPPAGTIDLDNEFESLKSGAEAGYYRSVQELSPIAEDSRTLTRDRAARKKQEEELERRRAAVAARYSFAEKLGFKERYRTDTADSSYGFANGPYQFFFWKGKNLDDGQAKAAFALASACLEADEKARVAVSGGKPVMPAVNGLPDALDVLQARWGDPAFRYGLYLGTIDSWERMNLDQGNYFAYVEGGKGSPPSSPILGRPNACVADIIRKVEPPFDAKKVAKVLADYRDFVEKDTRRREKIMNEAYARRERAERARDGARDSQPSRDRDSGGSGGLDLPRDISVILPRLR
jgi:hypothetical protein